MIVKKQIIEKLNIRYLFIAFITLLLVNCGGGSGGNGGSTPTLDERLQLSRDEFKVEIIDIGIKPTEENRPFETTSSMTQIGKATMAYIE